MPKLIDLIELPTALKGLSYEELAQIAEELREELIDNVSNTGGHLASSLGVTELTIALHTVFDSPADKLIWDVGHQAYIHKMLTGRRHRMSTIRMEGGLSGFPRPQESIYDAFTAGHAGTSISVATGIGLALKNSGDNHHAVAIIGDGAMTNGMAFEALNHAGGLELGNIIVVLNDNQMSISPNVGAIKWFFSRTLTSVGPTRARNRLKKLYKQHRLPSWLFKTMDRAEGATQGFISGPARLFEAFRFRYIGPIDGHDLPSLIRALRNAKAQRAPVLVHCYTQKGRGYAPAEQDPTRWHGVTPFRRETGTPIAAAAKRAPSPSSYTDVFGRALLEVAKSDQRVLAITAAMTEGTGLTALQEHFPERVIDVGICEQHAVAMAAGLASQGYKPICAIYASFLQRAVDQIMHDVCLQRLPVVFAIDRAGVVGADGHTHQGVFDIAMLRTLPEMVLMSPKDENELRHMLYTALTLDRPVALRYPRGLGWGVAIDELPVAVPLGESEIIREGEELLLISYGPVIRQALHAADRLEREYGITATVVNARYAKPLDIKLLSRLVPRHLFTATVEDHALAGGFGSAVIEAVHEHCIQTPNPIICFGVKDAYIAHATQAKQQQINGYDGDSIFNCIADKLGRLHCTVKHHPDPLHQRSFSNLKKISMNL